MEIGRKGLVFGMVLLSLALIYTASAHGFGGFGFGMGMHGMPMGFGYGMPMYPEKQAYRGYEDEHGNDERAVEEVSGKVVAVYTMSVKLDNGRLIRMPWWFIEELQIVSGDDVRAKGFSYGRYLVPVYLEINGEPVGDENSSTPVWMQGFGSEYGEHGYEEYEYHCPMMGW